MPREPRRKKEDALLSMVTRGLEPGSFQRRPYLPDLLNQPNLLLIPRPGRLVAIYVYDFGTRITWHSALGALEDLFELKTAVGIQVVAIAVIVRDTAVRL